MLDTDDIIEAGAKEARGQFAGPSEGKGADRIPDLVQT
jgi:hypothetical protein